MSACKSFLIVALMLLNFSKKIFADQDSWLCTETASQQLGDSSYLACGVATAVTESDARTSSLNNAINEFQGFCERSSNCRSRKVEFTPRRISCSKEMNGYKCYRAILVSLGDSKKQSELSEKELAYQINLKQRQLQEIQEKLRQEEELAQLNSKIDSLQKKKVLENAEVGLAEASYRVSRAKGIWFGKASLAVGQISLDEEDLTTVSFNGGVEFLPTSFLRLSGTLGYIYGASGDDLVTSDGEDKREHELRAGELYLGLGYNVSSIWLEAGMGYLAGSYEEYASGSPSGTNASQLRDLELRAPFYAAQVEYEREIIFMSLEYRKYDFDKGITSGSEVRFYIGGKW